MVINRMLTVRRARIILVVIISLLVSLTPVWSSVLAASDNGENKGNDSGQMNAPSGNGFAGNLDPYFGGPDHGINQETGSDGNHGSNSQNHNESCNNNETGTHLQKHFRWRTMSMTQNRTRTRICSEWQQQDISSAFIVLFDIDDGPSISFEFMPDSNSSVSGLGFDIQIDTLLEYLDDNENGLYDPQDRVVSQYSLRSAEFVENSYSTIESDDGEEVWVVSTGTSDGVFSMVVYVTGNMSEIQDMTISPSEIKIDFIIENFSYVDEDSKIALEMMLNTTHTVSLQTETFDEQQGFAKNENALNISSSECDGFFSWLSTALVDDVNQEVNVTMSSDIVELLTNETKQLVKETRIYFCYPQGDSIIHDPKIGIVEISYASTAVVDVVSINNIVTYLMVCAIASVLFSSIVVIRRRH